MIFQHIYYLSFPSKLENFGCYQRALIGGKLLLFYHEIMYVSYVFLCKFVNFFPQKQQLCGIQNNKNAERILHNYSYSWASSREHLHVIDCRGNISIHRIFATKSIHFTFELKTSYKYTISWKKLVCN